MAVLRSVAKTDTLESQRQVVNLLAQDLYGYTSGSSSIVIVKGKYGDGTLSAPSITFNTDETLGIYKESSQRLGIVSSNKPVLSLSPSGSYFAQNFYSEKRGLSTSNSTISNSGTNYEEGTYSNVPIIGGRGYGAIGNIVVDPSGSVTDVTIVNSGAGYTVGDILTVDPADISESPTGRVVDFEVIDAGQTYVTGTNVSTTGGSGLGLTVDITASANGLVNTIFNLSGGTGYTTTNNAATTGEFGTGATLNIVAANRGVIETPGTITAGSGYDSTTYSTTSSGSGTGATVNVQALTNGLLSTVSLSNAGSGYTTSSSVDLTSTGSGVGVGAQIDITAADKNVPTTISLVNPGTVYTADEVSSVSGITSGTGMIVSYTVTNVVIDPENGDSGQVATVSIFTPGKDYTVGDVLTIDNGSFDATISVTQVSPGGAVTNIEQIRTAGSNYKVNDILNISGGTGGQVTVTSVSGGEIFGVSILSGGKDYLVGDTVNVTGGNNNGSFLVGGVTGGQITSATISSPGSGYKINDLLQITGGEGVSGTVNVGSVSGGAITSITVNNPGTGYSVGNIITIAGVNNQEDKASYEIIDTSDGSGFTFTATSIAVTTPIIGNVLTGDLQAVSFTGSLAFIDDIASDSIVSDDVSALTNISTPQISSSNILNLDVVNDININTGRINIIDNNVTTVSVEVSNGNLTTNGEVKCLDGLNVNDITTIVDNKIETFLSTPLILKPSSGKNIKLDSNRALIVPVGSQVQRPQLDAETGAIRFNTDTRQFEGYDGDTNVWSSLGSVRDTDGNTYLLAESSVGANDNIFYFYNNNTNTLNITENELIFEGINSIISSSGSINLDNTSLSINENLTFTSNLIETPASGLTIRPSVGTNVVVDSQSSLVIPFGTSGQRGTATTGAIRFNTSNQQFEGYGLTAWSSLGGVRDVDGNTYIIPETSAGSNENILYFYNNNFNSLQLDQDKLEFRSANTISSIDIVGVEKWEPATAYEQNDLVYNGTNVYRITINLTSSGSGPTHTSGTTNNYQYVRTIYGNLTFNNINNVNINSVVNVNNKLKITNSDISSVTDDITITPFTGKLVKVNSTTSFVLPVGNSLNRGIAEAGAVRFNTATTQYEGYNGNAWTSLGGVRDVDGNTYIIPETSSGANENILYFYNDGDNTLRVTKTALTFQTANTITSNDNILNINVNDVRYASDTFGINSSSSTITKLYSGKNNLDIGLKSGLTNDALLRLSATGDIYVNTTFTEGSYTGTKVLDRSLTYFGLANAVLETNTFTLVKGTNNFNSYVLYDPDLASACKITIIAVDLSTYEKHMVDYNVIANGANIYNIEYEGLLSGNLLYDATFDFDSNGDVRLTATLDDSVSNGSTIEFTILKTFIR